MLQPLGNTTVLPPAGWHPEPRSRGTFSILTSCLITLSLCIWTSLHLNIPEHKKGYLQKYRKLGWMVLGLLAPEVVVWGAWEQRRKVKRLSALMRQNNFMPREPGVWQQTCGWAARAWHKAMVFLMLRADNLPELTCPLPDVRYGPDGNRAHPWTDTHSWYVVMGGIAFEDRADENERFMPGNHHRMTLTLDLFTWILEHEHQLIPDLSRESVEDKSKSDSLAKLITCWQTSYFCIQTTFRLSQNLSVTLLELNVFAHAICALLLFLIWWQKPRDIHEPTLLHGEEALDLSACIFHCERPGVFKYSSPQPLECCLEVGHPQSITASERGFGPVLATAKEAHLYRFIKVRDTYWAPHEREEGVPEVPYYFTLDSRDIERLVRVYRSIQRVPALFDSFRFKSEGIIRKRIRNTQWRTNSDPSLDTHEELMAVSISLTSLFLGLTFAGASYGALHLIAWDAQFSSNAQVVLWRAASVTLITTGPLIYICALCISIMSGIYSVFDSKFSKERANLKRVLLGIIGVFLLPASFLILVLPSLWYTLCRTFVVVECFVMLAHIPESALTIPTWSAYVPYIQ